MVSSSGENLVFVFSLPRSGSTLLSMILGGHHQVYSPPEPWFLLKMFGLTDRSNFNSIYDDEIATIGIKEFLAGDVIYEATNAFATAVYNNKLRHANKQIFVDKTPRYYHILNEIDILFPKAKKIWLKRNPLDVAWSYKDTWGLGPEMITGEKYVASTLDFSIGLFSIHEYFNKTSSNAMIVKYEELVASPEPIVNNLCDFIGINFDPLMLNYKSDKKLMNEHKTATLGDPKIYNSDAVHNKSVGSGYNNFTLDEIEKILHVIGVDIFDKYGYSEIHDIINNKNIKVVTEDCALRNREKIIAKNVDTVSRLQNELSQKTIELENCLDEIRSIQTNFSWRITAPLRKIANVVSNSKR